MSKYSITFCTFCKTLVEISEIKFVKLANNMVAIQGTCTGCGNNVLKGRVLPNTGKNPLTKYRRKLSKKRLNMYSSKKTGNHLPAKDVRSIQD